MIIRRGSFLFALALSACTAPGGPYPSLQPRAAEQIDPRVAVERPINDRPVSPALAGRLSALVEQARGGDGQFDAAAAAAERLAGSAGGTGSEGWVAAQEALSAAIAAREPTVRALADVDSLGADKLAAQGGLSPNDLAAIERAGGEIASIDERQATRLRAIQARLGL